MHEKTKQSDRQDEYAAAEHAQKIRRSGKRGLARRLSLSVRAHGSIIDRLRPMEEVTTSGLAAQLDADLLERYPGEPINGIDLAEFRASRGCSLVARRGSWAVECAAFRPLDSGTVEIKRMFVAPQFRGRGIGRSIVAVLEPEARTRGHTRAILETAVR
jgi:GNAT superfamily N-acetyltransferase